MPVRQRSKRSRKPKKRKLHRAGQAREIERMVKAGVERFILKEATIDEFLRTLRSAAAKNYVYSHQLTQSLFSKIVRQALGKRAKRSHLSPRTKRNLIAKGTP